jgi:hypothetical protein
MTTNSIVKDKSSLGRPTLLDDKLQDRIIEGIKGGLRPEQAFVRAGVCRDTYYNWQRRSNPSDKDFESRYFHLFDAIQKAEAVHEYDMVNDAAVKTKKSNNPITNIVYLSRRFPERYSEKIIMDQTTRNKTLEMLIQELRKPDKDNKALSPSTALALASGSTTDIDNQATTIMANKVMAKQMSKDD